MGRLLPLAGALLLAACGSTQPPRAVASADSIYQAVDNAERELAAAKAGGGRKQDELFGA
ncbi:MAG TPA: hypothetical protein VF631_01635 [Allosphingosinicella sp.]|jgi:uncharacterized lipoprotein YmbA|uniref:hypothetical protein n=1 Tax=Allosphingosinicella sp. TaxID=2823234 RepID=UPI002F27B7FE